MSPSTSTRWCPTPEQLMILEELYRRGLRTPNASQIQRITAHLAFHGKIQGKNVFYWFQNHKARDRQKLRKKLAKQLHQHHQHLLHHHHLYQSQSQSQTQSLHFQHPSPFHQLSNYFSAHNLVPQGSSSSSGVSEPWRGDECWMKSYGHDSMMVLEVGPSRSKPLETLELFPLRSDPTTTSTANEEEEEEDHQESTTSYLDEALPLLIK